MTDYLETFKIELKNRNYALKTLKTYSRHIRDFIDYSLKSGQEPEERIRTFIDQRNGTEQKRLAYSAIRLFYQFVIKKDCPYLLNKVRKVNRLPVVLSKPEILSILNQIKNKKHYCMISTLYSSGLRVSELTNLKIKDLDIPNLLLTVRRAKQNKDRITIISEKLVPHYQELIKDRKANEYLFTTNQNKKYTVRTVQTILKKAVAGSGIQKEPTCHTLRHSFATHLMENGIDIKSIRNLLGHKNIKTTLIYLHIADFSKKRIRSPF